MFCLREHEQSSRHETARLEKPVTITIKTGTLESCFRALRDHPEVNMHFFKLPRAKQKRIREAALEDLISASIKARPKKKGKRRVEPATKCHVAATAQ